MEMLIFGLLFRRSLPLIFLFGCSLSAPSAIFAFEVQADADGAVTGGDWSSSPKQSKDVSTQRANDLRSALSETKLTANDGSEEALFGGAVSVSGVRALIGAYADDGDFDNSGSAYIFEFDGNNWVEAAKLTASDAAADELFGYSVSLDGDRALIGALSGGDGGSAYVFEFDGSSWTETAKLTPRVTSVEDRFGISVSLSGDRAVVGADWDGEVDNFAGAAYVFDFDGSAWNEVAKLMPADDAEGDSFGATVSVYGDRVLVGARFDNDNGLNAGSAYMFDFDGMDWSRSAKLLADDGVAGDYFGASVSVSGDQALIGARFADRPSGIGSAYVYDFDGSDWAESAKLPVSDDAIRFGSSVSLFGDRALVGASDAAYVFGFDGAVWNELSKLTASDGSTRVRFADAVSFSGGQALVGARFDDDVAEMSGAAYLFSFNRSPVARDDVFGVLKNNVLNGNVFTDNGNGVDFDPDNNLFEIQSPGTFVAGGIGGSVTINTDGTFEYIPPSDELGLATFGYTIVDTFGATDSATVTINVLPEEVFQDRFEK